MNGMASRIVLFLLTFFSTIYAIFEDEAGKTDWYHEGIGAVKFAIFHPKQHAIAKRAVYVGTHSSVVAALNPINGDILWRQVLPEGESLDLLAHEKRILVTLSERGSIVRCWYANDGSLLWDTNTYEDIDNTTAHLSTSLRLEILQQRQLLELKEESKKGKREYPLPLYDAAFLPNQRPNAESSGTIQYDRKDVDDKIDPLVAVLYDNTVTVYEAVSGTKIWTWGANTHTDQRRSRLIAIQNNLYVLGINKHEELVITSLDSQTGSLQSEKTLKLPSSSNINIHTPLTTTQLLTLSSGWLVLLSRSTKELYLYSISESSTWTTLSVASYVTDSVADATLQSLASGTYLLATRQKKFIFSAVEGSEGATPFLTVEAKTSIYAADDKALGKFVALADLVPDRKGVNSLQVTLQSFKNGKLNNLPPLADKIDFHGRGKPEYGILNVYRPQANDQTPSYRLLLSAADHSLALFQKGATFWTKEEALASIHSVQFAELPHNLAFTEKPSFPPFHERLGLIARSIRHGIHHLKAQVKEIVGNVGSTAAPPEPAEDEELESDDFGFRRPILALSSAGKLYALDSQNGGVLWQRQITEQSDQKKEVLWRAYLIQHYTALVISHQIGNGEITSVLRHLNVLTGQEVEIKKPATLDIDPTQPAYSSSLHLNFQIQEVIRLPLKDATGVQLLLFVDSNLRVWVYPGHSEAINLFRPYLRHVFFYQVQVEKNRVEGFGIYEFQQKGGTKPLQVVFRCRSLWKVNFPSDVEQISAVALTKDEAIHSAVRVVGAEGTTLLYKYLNPNLIGVATVRKVVPGGKAFIPAVKRDVVPDPSVHIYLIDTVTGRIVSRTFHNVCSGPVHMAKSENSVYYHYWNVKTQQYELSVMELYQEPEEGESTVFSSLNTTTLPNVLQQTYILRTGVRVAEITSTSRGITEKELLLGLTSGQILSMPKRFVDPRRPTTPPAPADMAEGLVPYDRELPCDPLNILSYNQTITNIRGIATSPAGLESTSLVFTYGLDLYFIRITPSGTFDLLSSDFSYLFLIATVGVTAIGQIVAGFMSKRKQLQLDWA